MTISTSQAAPTASTPRYRRIGHTRLAPMVAPALTIVLSSFLLFLVQPILAKQILPWFGGSAGVWTICLVFFLPYLLLASTAPLLQRWLGGVAGSSSEQPSIYRLFALSNLGSLCGLLSYPFAIEPFATLRTQAWVWSSAYALFVACSITYACRRRQQHGGEAGETVPEAPPSLGRYAYWIGCSALGSALLLSGTNQITQNVASIPLLWIVPLSMYLLSFVICFEGRSGRGWYERRFWITPAMLAAGAMAWALFADQGSLSFYVALPVFTIGLLLGCVVCHGELARSKPNPNYLTHF